MELKKTPLYGCHIKAGGRMVPFSGWEMPIQYSTISEEHLQVRKAVGLFDVSHMGNFEIRGGDTEDFMNRILTNNYYKCKEGQLRYSHIPNEDGVVLDDMIAGKVTPEFFVSVPNAATIQSDYDWFTKQAKAFGDVTITNRSDEFAIIALQGPKARDALQKLTEKNTKKMGFFRFRNLVLGDVKEEIMVWSSGYTGEDGFEIMAPNAVAPKVWDMLMEAGREFGILPIGLGARDTLRLEKALLLSGQDFHPTEDQRTTLETNRAVKFALNWDHDFNGKEAFEKQKDDGGYDLLACILLDEKSAPPRHGYEILDENGGKVGVVTSGTTCPGMDTGFCMGYVPHDLGQLGTPLKIRIRNREVPAKVIEVK